MKQGWIKLHRRLLDNEVWKELNSNQKVVMITILLKANHDEKEWIFSGTTYTVHPGEFITSLKSLADESGTTVDIVRRTIKKLEELDFISSESTNKNRKITVKNWSIYQKKDEKNDTETTKQTTNQITYGSTKQEEEYKQVVSTGTEQATYGSTIGTTKQTTKHFAEKRPTNKKKELNNIYIYGERNLENKTEEINYEQMPQKRSNESFNEYLNRYDTWYKNKEKHRAKKIIEKRNRDRRAII